jgi:H+/Cl- antiporter ClcA
VLAGITAIGLAGNYSYFGTPDLEGAAGGVSLAMLGVALSGGVMGGVFSRALLFVSRGLPGGIGRFQARHPVLFAAGCGLIVALLGVLSGGQTYGTGYAEARAAIEGHSVTSWTYAPARALATLAALVSGIPGGLFAPSLSVGAGLGQWESAWFGEPAGPHWAVLGMCGYLAGVTQAPLTAFVIVLEMTAGHSMALPLMLTAAIGAGTSRLISPSLYRTLADRYGPVTGRTAATAGSTA